MGCCFSSASHPASPQPPTTQAAPPSSHSQSSSHPITRAPGAPRALSQVFNSPLKPHYWHPKERLWTPSALSQERQVFWDTAITNREEVWEALHLVCDELVELSASTVKLWETNKNGDGSGTENEAVKEMKERVKTAQGIIDAAGITLPTGDLVDGAYDTFGNHYALPVWVVCNPENLVQDVPGELEINKGDDVGPVPVKGTTDGDDIAILKGKGKDAIVQVEAPKVESLNVKCRLTDGRQDIVIKIAKDAKVSVLARKVGKVAEARIRLAYLGKMLDPTASLLDQGWKEGNVVSAMVFPIDR